MSHPKLLKSSSSGPTPLRWDYHTFFLNSMKRKIENFSLHTIQKKCVKGDQMRIALLADIHGNLVALETVLQELESEVLFSIFRE